MVTTPAVAFSPKPQPHRSNVRLWMAASSVTRTGPRLRPGQRRAAARSKTHLRPRHGRPRRSLSSIPSRATRRPPPLRGSRPPRRLLGHPLVRLQRTLRTVTMGVAATARSSRTRSGRSQKACDAATQSVDTRCLAFCGGKSRQQSVTAIVCASWSVHTRVGFRGFFSGCFGTVGCLQALVYGFARIGGDSSRAVDGET